MESWITNSKNKLSEIVNYKIFKIIFSLFRIIIEFAIISFIVITIVFFLINAVPGENPLTAGLDNEAKIAIERQYNLDKPIIIRFLNYILALLQGDFGISYSLFPTKPINDFIWTRFFISFTLGITSVFVTILLGIPIGILVGKNPGKFIDHFSTIAIAMLVSIPSMVFALFLLLLGRLVNIPYIFNKNDELSYILPVLSLSLSSTIIYVLFIRTELNSQLNSMHAKFAYLKGATKSRFVWKHALKPSLFPIATFFPEVVLFSFVGSLFIEKVFNIPGSGGMMLTAIQSKDYNVILFLVIIYSLLTILSYTLRDLLYGILDPRIRRKV